VRENAHRTPHNARRIMKVGILGGTFNPPHTGHLILAECARDLLKLDKVIFIPCNIPPHKSGNKLLKARIRLQMLRLAVKGYKPFKVSDAEIKRGGVSYTVDTLRGFKRINPRDKLFFIIGSDLFKDFQRWKQPQEIEKLAKIAVVMRTDIKSKRRGFIFFKMPRMDISSSFIRKRLKERRSIRYLVPREVELYIERHRLYR